MTGGWEDLVARVRGLGTHLLGRSKIVELGRMRELHRIALALEEAYGPTAGLTRDSSAENLEVAVRRVAGRFMRTIARWAGPRIECLAPLFLDEDRRSIRAALRGAAAGAPLPERLAGLVPTPELPERALEELARQTSVRGVAALLAAWGHPFGAILLAEARRPRPDLLRLDLLMNTEFATRSVAAARRAPAGAGARRELESFIRETVDVENAATALQLAGKYSGTDAGQLFVPEGKWLQRQAFLSAAAASDDRAALRVLLRSFRETALATVFASATPAEIEDAALASAQRRAARTARSQPLGVAPIIAFIVRLRAEVRDLRFIIWRVALGAPPATADQLVSVS